MNSCESTTQLSDDLDNIQTIVNNHAHRSAESTEDLLQLLRLLESLHQNIREELFLKSLPTNRHGLHLLLREIENEGGWPYIPRMRLKALMVNLYAEEASLYAEETSKEQP